MAKDFQKGHPFLIFIYSFLLLLFFEDFANIVSNLDIIGLDFQGQINQKDLEICVEMNRIRKSYLDFLDVFFLFQFL